VWELAEKFGVYAEGCFFLLLRGVAQKFKLPIVVLGDEYD